MEEVVKQEVKETKQPSILSWVLTIILSAIPLVNFVYLLVLAFANDITGHKRNYAKAMLLVLVLVYSTLFILTGFAIETVQQMILRG